MYLLDFLLHHRQRRDMRLKDKTDMMVRTAAIRPRFALIPERQKNAVRLQSDPTALLLSKHQRLLVIGKQHVVAEAAAFDRKWSPETQPKRCLCAVTFRRTRHLHL